VRCRESTDLISTVEQPLPFIRGGTKKEGKKIVLTLNKYMAMGPSGCDRAGWLLAVSYCSALLC
jgi:hypothetical protein